MNLCFCISLNSHVFNGLPWQAAHSYSVQTTNGRVTGIAHSVPFHPSQHSLTHRVLRVTCQTVLWCWVPPVQCLYWHSFHHRGTGDIVSAHGIPRDLLDRIIIVRMKPYGQNEVAQIIQIRAQTEGIKIENDAIQELSAIAERASLRWVLAGPSCVCRRSSISLLFH